MSISRLSLVAMGLVAMGLLTLGAPFLVPTPASAQTRPQAQDRPFLHALFSDNAVLQRDRSIPVWGWTVPGQTVTLRLDDKTVSARADSSGRWMARIGPYAAGGPHTLTVTSSTKNAVRTNIMFGDVWLCSGQSNMEMGLGLVNGAQQEIASANYPNIRLFMVPKRATVAPQETVDSQWLVCNPTNVAAGGWGGFSAVAYFFGRKLHQELGVPIGLIDSSWGGTEAESWLSESSLATLPDFRTAIAEAKTANADTGLPLDQRINNWLVSHDPTLKPNWTTSPVDDPNWKTINLPGNWENSGIAEFGDFDGLALFRRTVDIPAGWAGQDLTLSLGNIDDNDVTFWNGVQVGATNGWGEKRQYKIPGSQVKAGPNVIAIRVTDTGGDGGFGGAPDEMRLTTSGNPPIPLNGAWKYRINAPLEKLGSLPQTNDPNNPHRLDVLYNGMIAPLAPYGIKGAIWYQGENNANRAEQYGHLLPALIGDWRQQFATPFPFYIVQLASYMAPDEMPRNQDWPRLRAAQLKTAQTVPHSGIAITTDIGDQNDIHPKDKQDVGLRLALNALAKDYSQKVEYSGPIVKTVTSQGQSLAISFAHADGGLFLKGDTSRVFAVAGADLNWFWATPKIEENKVILTSAVVTYPMYVRYAWSNFPVATLSNASGLPAPPFTVRSTRATKPVE